MNKLFRIYFSPESDPGGAKPTVGGTQPIKATSTEVSDEDKSGEKSKDKK